MAQLEPDHSEQSPLRPASSEQQQALIAAIERHWDELLVSARVLIYKLGVPGDPKVLAQDALHDAVVTALRRAGTYDIMRPARPWLRGILFNAVRTLRRDAVNERKHIVPLADAAHAVVRHQSQHDREETSLSEDELFSLLGATARGSEATRNEGFEDLLALVSEADREVLRLAYLEELRGAELGARLGIKEGAAYTRLSRALDRLRAAYQQSRNRHQDDE